MESHNIPPDGYQVASEGRLSRFYGDAKMSFDSVKEPAENAKDHESGIKGISQDSHVLQYSGHEGGHPLRVGRENDTSGDSPITAQKQMRKAGEGENRPDDTDQPPGNRRHSRIEFQPIHTCAVCSTSFQYNYQLEQHATKDGHRSYACTCSKAFTKLATLNSHIYENRPRPQHKCSLCGKVFYRTDKISDHLLFFHKISRDPVKHLSAWKAQPRQGSGKARIATEHQKDDASTQELPSLAWTRMEVDSPWTSTLDVSLKSSNSLQDAKGNDRVSEEEKSFYASSSFGTGPKLPENAKYDVDEGDIRSDHSSCAEETMSVQSYADSLFDAVSVGSSAASVYNDTQALVGEFVDFLVRDSGLAKLFMRSMLPTVLGPERFKRNYSRILQSYARDLKRQISTWNETEMSLRIQGLAFISRRSITMRTASVIASRYMENAPQTQFHPRETEDDNAEIFEESESSGDESNHNFVISELGLFFREGAPFERMKQSLRNLVIPSTLSSRVKASTERMLYLVLSDDYLGFLLFKALSDPLGAFIDGQFDPKRAIRDFGSRLKAEACSPDQLRMAEFLETYAGYVATRALQKMEAMDIEAIIQQSQVSPTIS